jgi:nucleoside-diphosphate-sugar epimerase
MDIASMRILVTGGLGLIGHNVVNKLESLGHEITIVDSKTTYGLIPADELSYLMLERIKKIKTRNIFNADIADYYALDELINDDKPEIIIHLASFPRQKVVNVNPRAGSRTMSEGLLNLLELAKKHKVKRFVYISSSMVYGDFTNDVCEDAICKPQGQYGIMKLAGEWLVKDYTRSCGIEHTIIRPSAVYGPLDVEDRVISKFILSALRGQTLKVNGANETLDFTYVDDAANGIVAAALSENAINKTYNITKSHSRTLKYAAELAVEIAGKGSIEVRDKDKDFPSRGSLNIDAAKRDFGFDPKTDVEEGFKIYYNWIINSPFWSEKLKC